jgi:hypothetical protein
LLNGIVHSQTSVSNHKKDLGYLFHHQLIIYYYWLSVGYSIDKDLEINGTDYTIDAISYYDALNNFNYDSSANELICNAF